MRIRARPSAWAGLLLISGGHLLAQTQDGDRQLQEVTVTANRREESNQRVPLAITAVAADTAEAMAVTDPQSLAGLVPGLNFNRQANTSIPFLRGVGTPVGQTGNEPSVALYIDDVYMPAGSASFTSFNSIDRLEL